jgi:hypothetical protein
MTDIHFVEDGDLEKETEYKLPPFPTPLRPWNEEDCRYNGLLTDYKTRIHDKLFKVWALWGQLRTSLALEELLNRQEEDKEGDAYVAKNCIVDIINQLSKILADTDVVQELAWLKLTEEEFATRK